MLTLISPAKKLLPQFPTYTKKATQPQFLTHTLQLAQIMKKKSAKKIAQLMDLSHDLASLNHQRYQEFALSENPANAYPAIFLFQGDVYQGLQAADWTAQNINYAQKHLGILSGLYGLLKPLDMIQPYRLEMGIRLANPAGANLYDFWRALITESVNKQLAASSNPVLINLASEEYFKVVDKKILQFPLVTINFCEQKEDELKMIGIYAKKARGIMAKYIIQQQIDSVEGLKKFNESGYCFSKERSSTTHLDFIRRK